MALLEYILVALLGSAGAATVPGGNSGIALTRTLAADAVTQPNGGAKAELGQAAGGSPGYSRKQLGTGRKGQHHVAARRRHRGHRSGKVYKSGKEASKGGSRD